MEDSELRRNRAGFAAFEELRAALHGCSISENETGVYFDGNVRGLVEQCRIFKNAKAGIETSHGSAPVIRSCEIAENGPVGVSCTLHASPSIEGNLIRGHERGIETWNSFPIPRSGGTKSSRTVPVSGWRNRWRPR